MGLLDFFKVNKRDSEVVTNRKQFLAFNEGIPFNITIEDDMHSNEESLKYSYTNVKCNVIGDISDMIPGAILYVRRDGVLANAIKENVLQINNEKIRNMVNDFFDKDKFSTVRARYVSSNENEGLINIGFFVSYSVDDFYDDEE